jgi:hypothetical protein
MDAAIGKTTELDQFIRRRQPQLEPRRAQLQAEEGTQVYWRTLT